MSDSNMVVINDQNYTQWISPVVNGERRLPGYQGMWKEGFASVKTFQDLQSVPLIPDNEVKDRIREKERNKSRLKDMALDIGLSVLDQNGTNYCWINAPVFCCMVLRAQETTRLFRLSPASAGARIKNFRNVGGWGSEGLDWLVKHGVNEQSDWPANAIDSNYNTSENRERALLHQVIEYYKLDTWREVVSCILAGIPVAVGYDWWRHEVTGMDLTINEDLIIANSWSTAWGDRGYGVLEGNRKFPDDAVAITALTPI